MNPEACPPVVSHSGLIGDKEGFYWSFQNLGHGMVTDQSLKYQSSMFFIHEC